MSQKTCREGEPARGFLRCEAKEIGSDARQQSWERPERIHSNTLRIVSRRERGRWSEIIRRNRMAILW